MQTSLQYGAQSDNADSGSGYSEPLLGALGTTAGRPSTTVPAPSASRRVAVTDYSTAAGQKRRLSRAATTYPRKRATKACLICRFRRTKCDNARPACAACLRLGADCTYQETDHSTYVSQYVKRTVAPNQSA